MKLPPPVLDQSQLILVLWKNKAHERIASTWSRDRVTADIGASPLGAVTSYSTGDSGAAPMEVNQIKGKSKGKSKNAFGKAKGKGEARFSERQGQKQIRTKAKARTAMEKAMVRIRRANRKARFLERLMQTLAAIVEKQDAGKRTATRRRTTCRYDRVEEADPKDTAHNSGTAGSTTAVRAIQMLETSTTNLLVEDLTVFSQPSSSDSPFRGQYD